MQIKRDDLTAPEIKNFLEEHIIDMLSISPPESKHALDLNGLKKSDITFWTIWDKQQLIACGGLKRLDEHHAEIKSMRVLSSERGKGVASKLLKHILQHANNEKYQRISLETGSMPFFKPARKLYESFGFTYCDPFSDYRNDLNSIFMTLQLLE